MHALGGTSDGGAVIVQEPGSLGRVMTAVVNACSFGFVAFVTVLVSHELMVRFVLVTLAPRSLETIQRLRFLFDTGGDSYFYGGVAAGLATSALVVAAAANSNRVRLSYRSALIPIPIACLLGVQATSYRLLGLVLLIPTIWLCVQYQRNRVRLVGLAICVGATLLASLAPVDVTLQRVPGPPRVVPASFGLMGKEGFEMADRGDIVIVDGCMATYNHPRWAVVW